MDTLVCQDCGEIWYECLENGRDLCNCGGTLEELSFNETLEAIEKIK